MAQTYKIKTWDCGKQAYGPEREVTLAQYRAEVDAANARARTIYAASVKSLQQR